MEPTNSALAASRPDILPVATSERAIGNEAGWVLSLVGRLAALCSRER
jgi:hypothetical protein